MHDEAGRSDHAIADGTMAQLVRRRDWSATPLGDRMTWPQSLTTIVDVMLASRFPMCVGWGSEVTLLYNDAYVPFLGKRHPGALGRPLAIVWEEVWSNIEPLIGQAMAGTSVAFDDLPLTMTRHGYPEETWWTFSYSPIRNDDGDIAGFLNVATETTEKRLAIRQLQAMNETLEARVAEQVAERNLFGTLVETTDVIILALDFDYNILAINKAATGEFERIYGVRPRVGDNILDLLADQPKHQAQIRAGWGRGLAGEETTFVEEFGEMDRDRPYYEIRFRTLRNEAGEPIGAYQFVTDVTDRLREQAQLADAQEALRQSQKVEAVGQLTGGVAHDFNNLLTVIRGSIDLLRRPALPEDKRARYLDAISDTTDRATRLTSQLLAFARRQALNAETFDAGASIDTLRDMIVTLTGSRVVVSIQTADGPFFVRADRSQFDTAIVNMAVNARDAMSGEGTLTISVKEANVIPATRSHPAVTGQFIAMSITDTGLGIEADLVDRIFEPFYTTKGVGHGTGLGLSQVHGFAKQSSGDVAVRSQPGLGSTFTLYLPKAPEEALPPVPVEEGIKPLPQGACILIVEDNKEVGTFATQALHELGYKTQLAVDAAAALVELGSDGNGFDLVFSDVVMPGMSGIELGKEIHRRLPGLPVVLASGYSSVLAEQDTHEFELLQKPYSLDELARTLARVSGADRQ